MELCALEEGEVGGKSEKSKHTSGSNLNHVASLQLCKRILGESVKGKFRCLVREGNQ